MKQQAFEFPNYLRALLTEANAGNPMAAVTAVWGEQPEGWYCVSLRRVEPRSGFDDVWFRKGHDGRLAVKWDTVPEYARVGDDFKWFDPTWETFWCIAAFSKPRRIKENVLPSRWLFADLDWVPPHEVPFMPTFSWQTSPGKWQCVWYLQVELDVREFEHANKTICRQSGADPGTWNINRLLRAPGSHHLKAEREALEAEENKAAGDAA